jgi:hypothetical protein
MDTPGLGDTRGIEQDDKNIENILQTILMTPELNGIVIIINGTECWLSERILYAIQRMKGILPNVLKDNLIVLMTNVATKPNLNIKDLEMDLPQGRLFYVNNSIFSTNLKTLSSYDRKTHNVNYNKTKESMR